MSKKTLIIGAGVLLIIVVILLVRKAQSTGTQLGDTGTFLPYF